MARTAAADRAMLAPPGQRRRARSGSASRGARQARRGRPLAPGPRRSSDGNKVERIYHTSSGAPGDADDPRALPASTLAQPGYNAKEMYCSKYFIRGYAIHGYKSVPVFNACHGCLRVPLADAVSIYNWIQIGDRIDVYD